MARSAADRAGQAADALDAFLRDQPQRRAPSASQVPPAPTPIAAPRQAESPIDRPATPPDDLLRAAPLRLAHTDWLRHTLAVHGGTSDVAAFRQAAAGAGIVPWHLDVDRMEEDFFHLLATSPHRSLGLAGARVLAEQLRTAVEHRQALANARVGQSPVCPFDLHSLVRVPDDVLQLGPDHPQALAWLWQHWGTTEPLRHVAEVVVDPRRDGAPRGRQTWAVGFWAADWTPWQAIRQIREWWPALSIEVRPVYELD